MALARKCDRCGTYFGDDENVQFRCGKVNAIRLFDMDKVTPNRGYGRKLYDLCPKCLEELRHWLEKEENQDGRKL